ncbi:uncharacterized protein LOC143019112 [Oratosquilla oratoria]|uniref:uncharacterized protein LOC143019112 n=1 Tax=Oratosquilla oratoria TaxID=337810 RepID=UPI003F7665CD
MAVAVVGSNGVCSGVEVGRFREQQSNGYLRWRRVDDVSGGSDKNLSFITRGRRREGEGEEEEEEEEVGWIARGGGRGRGGLDCPLYKSAETRDGHTWSSHSSNSHHNLPHKMKVLCALLMSFLALVAGEKLKDANGDAEGAANTRFFGGPPLHAQVPPLHAHGPPLHAQGPPLHAHGPPLHAQGPPVVPPGLGGHVLPVLGGAVPPVAPSSDCRYWCKTPEGAAYCCETTNQVADPIATQIVKPGICPPVRPVCPRIFGPPITCSNDGACSSVDKCCFDRCLKEHVCKAPLGFGR